MRDFLRLAALFLVAVIAMAISYGAGFATALQVQESPSSLLAGRDDSRARSPVDAAAGAFVTPDATRPSDPAASSAVSGDAATPPNFGVFWEVWNQVRDEYYGEAPADTDITYGAIRGSLRALGDPYTVFTDPEDTEMARPSLEGEFEGIGAFVNVNEDGFLEIQTPMRGRPADQAGILAGDLVIKVDGEDITGMDVTDAVLLIRGPKGTTVELTILREDETEPLVIPVIRDRIEIPSVDDVRILTEEGAPEVGYLALTEFALDTKTELEEAMAVLRSQGAEALILDVRNNPGGFLTTAIEVTSEFVDEGIVVIQEASDGQRRIERARPGGQWLDLPVVVLVNRGSASASEILAGAMRDHGRGLLVGETTFGKGSVQNVHTLSDESQLRVTVAVWLTPNGDLIHQKGIEPDVAVEITKEDREAELDPQMDRAIQEAKALIGGS